MHTDTKVSAELERRMHVPGPFGLQPRSMGGVINEPVAAAIVYPAVLTAWALIATTYSSWQEPAWLPYVIGVAAFGSAVAFFLRCRNDAKFQADLEELAVKWAKGGRETKETVV